MNMIRQIMALQCQNYHFVIKLLINVSHNQFINDSDVTLQRVDVASKVE